MNAHRPIVTCEHGGNRVPTEFEALFRHRAWYVNSHRGWDPGALELARYLARIWHAPIHVAKVTRLLVDLNRTRRRNLFSAISRRLDPATRERILAAYYRPYRGRVEAAIHAITADGRVAVHLSVHTFVPLLYGRPRRLDLGLLYDPARPAEADRCQAWRTRIEQALPSWRVRFNQPYRGAADGFTSYLRTRFSDAQYLGIELEVNQRLFEPCPGHRQPWFRGLADSLDLRPAEGNGGRRRRTG